MSSRSEPRSTSHPFRVYFTGEAGEEVAALLTKNKGFISHHASIVTSGMNGGAPFVNPINVTAYGSTAEALIPKNVYSMNCKLIGTNNDVDDHLHFENTTRVNLGPIDIFPEAFVEELMDKVNVIALGIVVDRELIRDPEYHGKPTVVVTLKSTDYDPFTRAPVSWLSKHFVPPLRNLEKAQNLCQLGREVQLVGAIKDYDTAAFMWLTEVSSISVTSGHISAAAAKPNKALGAPNGGRVALSLRRTPAKRGASTSAVRIDSSDSVADQENTSPLRDFGDAAGSKASEGETADIETADKEVESPVVVGKRPRRG